MVLHPSLRGVLLAIALAVPGILVAQEPAANDRIEGTTRPILEKWVETRRTISKEKRDWALGKEVLNDRIALVEREIDALRAKIADAKRSIEETEKKKAELAAASGKLKETASVLASGIGGIEGRTKELLAKAPEPVRQRVKLLAQRIPADPAATKLSLGERFQNLAGVLNEINKFHREIVVEPEVRVLGDGSRAEVPVLYLGLGQAFYASTNGRFAGVGRPGRDGWEWTSVDDAAPVIARAIAILKNEEVAAFVPLPIRID